MWPFRKSLEKVAIEASDRDLVDAVFYRSPRKYEDFSAIQRGVHSVWWLEAETDNGGIEQYFTNSTADGYPLLCQFLMQIGAIKTLDSLKQFGSLFGNADANFPARSTRIDFVSAQEESHGNAWETSVDEATDEIRETYEDLTNKLANFIRLNLETIEE